MKSLIWLEKLQILIREEEFLEISLNKKNADLFLSSLDFRTILSCSIINYSQSICKDAPLIIDELEEAREQVKKLNEEDSKGYSSSLKKIKFHLNNASEYIIDIYLSESVESFWDRLGEGFSLPERCINVNIVKFLYCIIALIEFCLENNLSEAENCIEKAKKIKISKDGFTLGKGAGIATRMLLKKLAAGHAKSTFSNPNDADSYFFGVAR
jgi:hypothetical protein